MFFMNLLYTFLLTDFNKNTRYDQVSLKTNFSTFT